MSDQEEFPQGHLVYRQLLDEISSGALQPGVRMREVEIAERLGISRTPVREALRMMESDGLVTHQPRLGATIRTLEYAEIIELYEMRVVFEGTAARLSARVASDVEIAQLETLNEEFAAAADDRKAATLNRQFHLMLLDSAKNRFLTRAVHGLRKTMMILGPTTLMDPVRTQVAVDEHRRVLAAIKERDGVRAELEMRAHLEAAQHARLKSLRPKDRLADD